MTNWNIKGDVLKSSDNHMTRNTICKKQNGESTEGYSKSIVRKNNDKFRKRIGLNKQNICKSLIDGTRCPEE